MTGSKEPPIPDTEQVSTEEPPPFNPDPELITFLEREAKPGEIKVWVPDETK